MSHTLNVRATRWSGGWELEIDEHHHTQSRTLADAGRMVRDYLDSDRGGNHSDWTINIIPEVGELDGGQGPSEGR
ncbi:hypothetical protein FAM22020_001291 [Propionibacterium freudenreichii]|uniref:Uncharacterized protein n=1 Tax=Propionibacterium freudenreichii subsp. freudenreichii TaxID=66712 RepID=A0A0B7P1T0_PROFF|nr:hypothetical protein [Propionibacterium freudenreichii]CEP27818.1 Putative uncharacterized protein [Propionibacterium freudenreichii subsp. freudenreichii]MCT2996541.1 hypothetical protein [Propionibacterium freudenreichii]MDK9353620.1 hypothetical protein [Propionibacterium freudenreichii]MDK9646996.1 hypothetical protein [Propionibacterium freudenreichii]MDK9656093.1 hypothetical protein [Propionibacterium freudenreichii]